MTKKRITIKAIAILTAFVALGLALVVRLDLNHASVEKVHSLYGLSELQLIKRLGEPSRSDSFILRDVGDELRMELLNHFPSGAGENREIKELAWKYPAFQIVVWLTESSDDWFVLENCRYQNGVRF